MYAQKLFYSYSFSTHLLAYSLLQCSFKTDVFSFSSSVNQLGKVNELIIKPDPSELTEEKDVVEETVEEESGSKADCVFTATSLETALNLVITLLTRPSAGGDL